MVKIILDHNNLHFCSGPCDILSPEYSIVDSNDNYLFELKPYDGNRYPKITYKLPNNRGSSDSCDIVEVINCRICAECHKKSLDLTEGSYDKSESFDGINVIKKFILLECCTEDAQNYIKNYNNILK
jgi:hypothetical protein